MKTTFPLLLDFASWTLAKISENKIMSELKFAANINWMFTEVAALEERIAAAKEAGFTAVECVNPYSVKETILAEEKKKHGMTFALINAFSGDVHSEDRTLIANPNRVEEFKEHLEVSIRYAKALDCSLLHMPAGSTHPELDIAKVERTYMNNLKYAAERLRRENMTAVVEFLNSKYTFQDILVDTPEKALRYIKNVDHSNCKFQMDLFHLQIMCGDLTHNLERYMPYTEYIQISQCPGRGEPYSSGEINYDYILPYIQKLGYTGYIGLEYHPTGVTVDGLEWMKKWK